MAVNSRKVKNKCDENGVRTGRAGTVYDVNIKYNTPQGKNSYAKKGFLTKKEAVAHEAEMRVKLTRPGFVPVEVTQSKQTLAAYLTGWLADYGKMNLRPNTLRGYTVNVEKHLIPNIGNTALRDVTAAALDKLYSQMLAEGLSHNTVKYVHLTLSIALEHARKYRYIESNPTRDILTRFPSEVKTPDPYTVDQMATLLAGVRNTQWEMIIVLAGLYGLRRNEVLGLNRRNVDLQKRKFLIEEQLAPDASDENACTAPVKEYSSNRTLPITNVAYDVFKRHREHQRINQALLKQDYHDNGLVVCKDNGDVLCQTHISRAFNRELEKLGLPPIRFHDLRHSYVKATTKNFLTFFCVVK